MRDAAGGRLWAGQAGYAQRILADSGMERASAKRVPMAVGTLLAGDESDGELLGHGGTAEYKRFVGQLLYLA